MAKSDTIEKSTLPKQCPKCGEELLEDQDNDLFCPGDCDMFYHIEKKKWYTIN